MAAACWLAVGSCWAGNMPKGCYEKTWSKAELKKLPLQQVTSIRIEAGTSAMPDNKPISWGSISARFRDTGEQWFTTAYECSDTGAGLACATICDGGVFVTSSGSKGLRLIPQKSVTLFGADCAEPTGELKLNADKLPFVLGRLSSRACPAR